MDTTHRNRERERSNHDHLLRHAYGMKCVKFLLSYMEMEREIEEEGAASVKRGDEEEMEMEMEAWSDGERWERRVVWAHINGPAKPTDVSDHMAPRSGTPRVLTRVPSHEAVTPRSVAHVPA